MLAAAAELVALLLPEPAELAGVVAVAAEEADEATDAADEATEAADEATDEAGVEADEAGVEAGDEAADEAGVEAGVDAPLLPDAVAREQIWLVISVVAIEKLLVHIPFVSSFRRHWTAEQGTYTEHLV